MSYPQGQNYASKMSDKEAALKLEEAKKNLTRGNGIADFMQVK
jgi:hypothetical protein